MGILEARPYGVLCGWLAHSECSWFCKSCGLLLNCISANPPLLMFIHAIWSFCTTIVFDSPLRSSPAVTAESHEGSCCSPAFCRLAFVLHLSLLAPDHPAGTASPTCSSGAPMLPAPRNAVLAALFMLFVGTRPSSPFLDAANCPSPYSIMKVFCCASPFVSPACPEWLGTTSQQSSAC